MSLFVHNEKKLINLYFFGGMGILWLCYSHYFFYGQDSIFYANDYLELVVPWFKHLVNKGAVFKQNTFMIPGMLSEMPRGLFPSEFYLETWMYLIFEPFQAILFNIFLIHTVAYVSAFHFISSLEFQIPKYRILLFSICWSTMGFWAGSGIGAAAIPSVYYIFHNLFQGKSLNIKYLAFLIFYAFYSYFHLHGLFVISCIFIMGIVGVVLNKKLLSYFLGFSALLFLYILFNYRLIDIYFFQREWFVPHRLQYDIYSFAAYHENYLKNFTGLLLFGAFHSITTGPLLFGFSLILYLSHLFSSPDYLVKCAKFSFLAAVGLAALSMAVKYLPVVELIPMIENFSQFSYERFSFFVVPLMFFSFVIFAEKNHNLKYFNVIFNSILIILVTYNVLVINENLRNKIIKPILNRGEKYSTFREFYSVNQFVKLKGIFDKRTNGKSYKIASLGIHPAVAIYNGIPSIDGYAGIYDLKYKIKFFGVIKEELKQDQSELYGHFMGWGNKCYLFNNIQGDDFLRWKWREKRVINPKYDYKLLYYMGCRFLISTDPIEHVPQLEYLGILESPESAWSLFIYEIKLI